MEIDITSRSIHIVRYWFDRKRLLWLEADDGEDDLHAPADVAVPGWLLAGVSLERQAVIDGQPEDLKDN